MSKTSRILLSLALLYWIIFGDFLERLKAPAPVWLILVLLIGLYLLLRKGADDAEKIDSLTQAVAEANQRLSYLVRSQADAD